MLYVKVLDCELGWSHIVSVMRILSCIQISFHKTFYYRSRLLNQMHTYFPNRLCLLQTKKLKLPNVILLICTVEHIELLNFFPIDSKKAEGSKPSEKPKSATENGMTRLIPIQLGKEHRGISS